MQGLDSDDGARGRQHEAVHDQAARRRRRQSGWRRRHPERAAGYALLTAGLVGSLALADGGYDILVRHWAAALVWAAVVAVALLGPRPRRPPRAALPLLAGLAGLLLLSAASLAWTTSVGRTVEEAARVAGYGGVVVLVLLLVDRRVWKSTALGLLYGAAGICALALLAALFPGGFDDPDIQGRLAYPFGYPNALAAWAVAAWLMALSWSVEAGRRRVRSMALAAAVIAGAALWLTFSRTGVVVALAGAVALLALTAYPRRALAHLAVAMALAVAAGAAIESLAEFGAGTEAERLLALACMAAAAAAAAVGAGSTGSERWSRQAAQRGWLLRLLPAIAAAAVAAAIAGYSLLAADGAASVDEAGVGRLLVLDGQRPDLWRSALDAFVAQPEGVGPGAFSFWWAENGSGSSVLDAHSLFLEALAELGLAGLLAVSAVALGLIWAASAPRRAGDAGPESLALPLAAVAFVLFAATDWLWESTAVTVLALSCAAIGSRGLAGARAAGRRPESRGRRARTAIAVLAVAMGVLQLPGAVATMELRAAERAVLDGDLDGGVGHADRAIAVQPWAAIPYLARGQIELARGDGAAARADARRAIEREPLEYRSWLLAFRADAQLGRPLASLRAYRRARELGYASPP